YAGTPDGVFEKKPNSATRRFVSPSSVSQKSDQAILKLYRSHNYLRTHPDFVRMDEVAGPKVYVLITGAPANPTQCQDNAYIQYNRSLFGGRALRPAKVHKRTL